MSDNFEIGSEIPVFNEPYLQNHPDLKITIPTSQSDFSDSIKESRDRWEKNAYFWDERMGDTSNDFHRLIVRPHTGELPAIRPGDLILDIACGTGNFSERMAQAGAIVFAFDYSRKMINTPSGEGSHIKRQ